MQHTLNEYIPQSPITACNPGTTQARPRMTILYASILPTGRSKPEEDKPLKLRRATVRYQARLGKDKKMPTRR